MCGYIKRVKYVLCQYGEDIAVSIAYISLVVCRLCTVQDCPGNISDDSLIQIYWTPTWLCRRTPGQFVQISRPLMGNKEILQRADYLHM